MSIVSQLTLKQFCASMHVSGAEPSQPAEQACRLALKCAVSFGQAITCICAVTVEERMFPWDTAVPDRNTWKYTDTTTPVAGSTAALAEREVLPAPSVCWVAKR